MASGQPVYLYVQVGLWQIWQKSLHKAWSSIDLWPRNQIASSLSPTGTKYVYVKTVCHTFLDDFFLPWAEIWAHFSQFSLEQDCRFVSDLMEIPEGIPELWCLLSIRLQWPLLSKIWMSSSLSQSFHLRQICTNLPRDCSKTLKDCEAGVTYDL